MAPKYKLTYFGVRSRGEIPRLVFAAAKVPYEFKEIAFEDWPKTKPETPYGGLPMLEIDGEKHGQGMAIATFLAAEFSLIGKTNKDRFLIEQLLHLREDMLQSEAKHFLESDAAKKAEYAKTLDEDVYPRFMALFTTALKKNGGGKGFVVGSKLSLGDLILYGALTTPCKNNPKVMEKFPELLAHRKRISEIDGIKQHVASLPDMPI